MPQRKISPSSQVMSPTDYTQHPQLNSNVTVEKEEYDEIVAIKPMFLVMDYK